MFRSLLGLEKRCGGGIKKLYACPVGCLLPAVMPRICRRYNPTVLALLLTHLEIGNSWGFGEANFADHIKGTTESPTRNVLMQWTLYFDSFRNAIRSKWCQTKPPEILKNTRPELSKSVEAARKKVAEYTQTLLDKPIDMFRPWFSSI